MRQEEFLQSFQEALTGEVSESVIQNHLAYYKNYIYEEVRKGRSQEDVLSSLGNPRLLAKTIIDTNKSNDFTGYDYEKNKTYDSYNSFHSWEDAEEDKSHGRFRHIRIPSWLMGVLSILVIAVIIGLAFCAISYLAPVILTIVGIGIVVNVIRRITRDGF